VAEWVVRRLSYSARWRELCGMPRLLLDADPALQREIILGAEKAVYGKWGLERSEAAELSSLRSLARRSLAQHLCQRALRGGGLNGLRRVVCAFAFPTLLAMFVLATVCQRKPPVGHSRPHLVVFFWAERLYKFIGDWQLAGQKYELHRKRAVYFAGREIRFFLRTIAACPRILCYPELLCNLIRWLGYYGYATKHYQPKEAVVHFFEGTASSSLMTAYLHQQGLRHINVQHGEVMFTAMSAFCQFDEIHVWGGHFREIFLFGRSPAANMRVSGTRYHRELFRNLRTRRQPRPKRLLIIDPFMYQDPHTPYALIKQVVERLEMGWDVRVRRHPAELRKTLAWMEELNAGLKSSQKNICLEEEGPTVPIEEALNGARIVLGIASTVLIEAWIAGCKVIHIAGGPERSVVMDRYQNSANVFYCGQNTVDRDLDTFIAAPVELNERERALVNYLTVLEESGP
jgi:hypothetical protein